MEPEFINTTYPIQNMGNCWSGVTGLLERCTKPQYEPIEERRSKLNAELSANPVNVDINGRDGQQRNNRGSSGTEGGITLYQAGDRAASSGDSSVLSAAPTPSGFFYKYELKNEIGVGSTSKCFRCVRKSDGMVFACKVIDKSNIEAKFSGLLGQFLTEIKVLRALNHENIIHLEDDFETSDRIYLVMEMMSGGELFDYVVAKGTLSEEEASELIRKICSAVAHMHASNIIHRDLKPENLLLTASGKDAQVKLIDFGLAKVMHEDTARSFLGTKGYLAPVRCYNVVITIRVWICGAWVSLHLSSFVDACL